MKKEVEQHRYANHQLAKLAPWPSIGATTNGEAVRNSQHVTNADELNLTSI